MNSIFQFDTFERATKLVKKWSPIVGLGIFKYSIHDLPNINLNVKKTKEKTTDHIVFWFMEVLRSPNSIRNRIF